MMTFEDVALESEMGYRQRAEVSNVYRGRSCKCVSRNSHGVDRNRGASAFRKNRGWASAVCQALDAFPACC